MRGEELQGHLDALLLTIADLREAQRHAAQAAAAHQAAERLHATRGFRLDGEDVLPRG